MFFICLLLKDVFFSLFHSHCSILLQETITPPKFKTSNIMAIWLKHSLDVGSFFVRCWGVEERGVIKRMKWIVVDLKTMERWSTKRKRKRIMRGDDECKNQSRPNPLAEIC